jgi:Holliday junction resolvase RusA-like endonuclease
MPRRKTTTNALLKAWAAIGLIPADAVPPRPAGTAARVELPPPPSVNNLFRNVPGVGRVKSSEYKAWLALAAPLLARLRPPPAYPCGVNLAVVGGPGLSRRRDIDNLVKPVLDAAVAAGVLAADDLGHVALVEVRLFRPPPGRPAFVAVSVAAVEVPTWSET